MMHARATVVTVEPAKLDAVIAFVRDSVLPVVDEQSGSLGLSMNVDRESGRCTITTVWADRASMNASDFALSPLRDSTSRIAGAPLASEGYELPVLHRLRQAEPGCWVRTTRLQLDPASVDAGIKVFRRETVPQVERLPGFRSVLLLTDRRTGSGAVSVVFDDRDALEASRAGAEQLRRASSAQARADVTGVAEGEIVLAHLRLPLTSATEEAPETAQPAGTGS